MLAAATAWDVLADEVSQTAASFESIVMDLTGGPWRGPTAMSMAAAALPFAAWLKATASQAEQAASQAKAAAAAYEAAFAMTVPPPVVAANRAQLMFLIATNFFGQNTPAIAATEVQYAAMWAQDSTAMYGYAGSTKAASKVSPYTSPPQTTNPAGLGGQSAATGHSAGTSSGTSTMIPSAPAHPVAPGTAAPQALAQLGSSATTPGIVGAPGSVTPVPPGIQAFLNQWSLLAKVGGQNYNSTQLSDTVSQQLITFEHTPKAYNGIKDYLADAAKAAESTAKGVGMSSVRIPGVGGLMPAAGLAQAAQVGALSVPSSWPGLSATANPATATLVASRAASVATGDAEGARRGAFGFPGVPGAAGVGGGHGFRFVPRYGYRHKVMTRPSHAG